jgi:ABC-type branched-subunit amino acid transport system ATPase component
VSEPLLQVRDVDAAYGPVQILFGLDLDVSEGEIVALLGTNGAGKSTLFKCVTGLLPPSRGRIVFDGEDLVGRTPDEIAELGVVMMPGGKSVFPTLTVRENLRLACWLKRKDRAAVQEAEDRVLSLFPRLAERIDQMAGNLSGGEQQQLAVGQALIPDPRLLLIDELSLGLAPSIVGQLIDVVREVHAAGLTVVVVEQSINVALTLAERAVFMEKGGFRFTGPTSELLERPDILRSVFITGAGDGADTAGDAAAAVRAVDAPLRSAPPADAPVVLSCTGVTKRFGGIVAVDQVDLELRQGQILGLIGQNGAGKTTLFDCVSGFLPVDSGTIVLDGTDITALPAHQRAALGLGRSFQEARLFPTLTTAETLALARERHRQHRSG